ncbi:MAG: hypothetical protein LBP75_07810 [Planctomycetota bacterium]|jgi:hypothetical protein|nr:hypothetical protein [Planctomycetota bacterium]
MGTLGRKLRNKVLRMALGGDLYRRLTGGGGEPKNGNPDGKMQKIDWSMNNFGITDKNIGYDGKFYIIRPLPNRPAGLFSWFHFVLSHIIFAVENGWTPMVDMKNYRTLANEDHPVNGTMNYWEYYFEQPANYDLLGCYFSENVVLSDTEMLAQYVPFPFTYYRNTALIAKLHAYITEYMKFKREVIVRIDEYQQKKFGDKKNIMAVMVRSGKVYQRVHHNIMPDNQVVIDKVRQLLAEWRMEWIFLSIDFAEGVDEFRRAFGDKLIVIERARLTYDYLAKILSSPQEFLKYREAPLGMEGVENARYTADLLYLIEVVLASRCDALAASLANGAAAAVELNGNQYRHTFFFDEGKQPVASSR